MAPIMNDAPCILALETSGRVGSAALAKGPELIAEGEFSAEQTHSREALPVVDRLCRRVGWSPEQLRQVYVSVGPGSFTGLRVGITAAKTLAFALDLQVVAVPSTEVTALNTKPSLWDRVDLSRGQLAVVMDAKRGQIYAAVFEPTDDEPDRLVPGFRTVMEATVLSAAELLARTVRPLYVLGEGLRWHGSAFRAAGVVCLPEPTWRPRAANVHRCGWRRARAGLFTPPETLTPLYLRRPEAEEKWQQRHKEQP